MKPQEFQNLEIAIVKKATALFANPNVFRDIGNRLCQFILKLIIQRILAGYDLFSRKFGGYNESYNKEKAYNYAVRKYGSTEWASKSKKDKLRLTGNLLSSLDVKLVSIQTGLRKVVFRILISTKDPTQIPKILGLQSETGVARNRRTYAKKAYYFMGLALSGEWKIREEREIRNFLVSELENIISKKIEVKRA